MNAHLGLNLKATGKNRKCLYKTIAKCSISSHNIAYASVKKTSIPSLLRGGFQDYETVAYFPQNRLMISGLQLPYPHYVPLLDAPFHQQTLPGMYHLHLPVCSNVHQFPETFVLQHFLFPVGIHDEQLHLPALRFQLCYPSNYYHTHKLPHRAAHA